MRRRLLPTSGVKCVVPVSGGKDSQACLKLAVEEFGAKHVLGLFCDTGWEHPLTLEHVEREQDLYGVHIHRVCAGSVPERILKYGMFPLHGNRFCTDELKLAPANKFYQQLATTLGHGFQVFSGVRTQESSQRARRYRAKVSDELYDLHEIMPGKFPKLLATAGVQMRLPILDWSAKQVMDFVGRKNLNPLYSKGFDRVGCFPCMASGDANKEKHFTFDDVGRERKVIALRLEQQTGQSMWGTNSARKRHDPSAPCGFCLFS